MEQAADMPVYRATFGTARPGGPLSNALDIQLKNPANTNVLLWGEPPNTRLLALWEVRCPPHGLCWPTLGPIPCRGSAHRSSSWLLAGACSADPAASGCAALGLAACRLLSARDALRVAAYSALPHTCMCACTHPAAQTEWRGALCHTDLACPAVQEPLVRP